MPSSSLKPAIVLRADIQGLRAIAVLAVIADHLFHWPSGGFIGVDVFFVISGFLITGLLLREHERSGTLSFTKFYARRAKRILPASILVLGATVLTGTLLFNAFRAQQTFTDAVWALFFGANWRFAFAGTDYFAAGGPVSPLQHFWSLSVEEQFYFVWPWLMLLIFALAGRSVRFDSARSRGAVGVAMGVIVVVSFGWSVYESAQSSTMAHFSTFSRAWELGVGALLAVLSPLLLRIPDALRPALAWAGLALIAGSLLFITSSLPFPGPWALLPVLATAAVIAAGTGGPQRGLLPLRNRPVTYVGDISYSLYLWHFPVIVFGLLLLDPAEPVTYPILLAIIFVISIGSYHLVEKPLHKSPILERFTTSRRRNTAWREWREQFAPTYRAGLVAIVAVSAVGLAVIAFVPPAPTSSVAPHVAGTARASGAATDPPVDPYVQQLSDALTSTAWPTLSPSLDNILSSPQLDNDVTACGGASATDRSACRWGSESAPQQILLLGDSTSLYYTSIFKRIAEASNGQWSVSTYAMFGCRFFELQFSNVNPAVESACPGRITDAIALVQQTKPAVVVVSNAYAYQTMDESTLNDAEWARNTGALTEKLVASAGKVVFLAAPPGGVDLASCYSPLSAPEDCVGDIGDAWKTRFTAESGAVTRAGGLALNSRDWMCIRDRCPSFVGTTVIRHDPNHLTAAFAELVTPIVQQEFAAAGLPFT